MLANDYFPPRLIVCIDNRFFPTVIELTNKNGAEGIVTSFQNAYSKPNWKSNAWHTVKIPLSSKHLRHANVTVWEDMERLEIYRNGAKYDLSTMGDIRIILRNFNFVKVGDVTPYGQTLKYVSLDKCWSQTSLVCTELSKECKTFNAANRWVKRSVAMTPCKYGIGWGGTFSGSVVSVYGR